MKLPTSDELKKHFPNVEEFVLKNTLAVSQGIFTARTRNLNILSGMTLLADREYCGETWFTFLRSKGIHFIIRLKEDAYLPKYKNTAILVFLFVLCIRQGFIAYQKSKKSDYKQFIRNGEKFKTLAVSIFRKGIAYLENLFYEINSFIRFLNTIYRHSYKPDFLTHVQ